MINRDSWRHLYCIARGEILGQTIVKAFAKDVFINQEQRLGDRKQSDTVVVSTVNYADLNLMHHSAPYKEIVLRGRMAIRLICLPTSLSPRLSNVCG